MVFAVRLTPEQRKEWQVLANLTTDGNVSAMLHLAVAAFNQPHSEDTP